MIISCFKFTWFRIFFYWDDILQMAFSSTDFILKGCIYFLSPYKLGVF